MIRLGILAKAEEQKSRRAEEKKEHTMIRLGILAVILLLEGTMSSGYAWTYSISSSELIEKASQYDGKMVYFEGELIGEVMKRGDFAWLNLSDGAFGIGVFANSSQLPKITYHGGYKSRGDTLRVKGIFHHACPEHGGDLDIHANSIKVIKPGYLVKHPINLTKVRLALLLSLIALILISIHVIKTKVTIYSNEV